MATDREIENKWTNEIHLANGGIFCLAVDRKSGGFACRGTVDAH